MIDDQDWERLARYLSGESSMDEAARTRAWLDADAGRRVLHEELRATCALAKVDRAAWDSSGAWERMAERVSEAAAVAEEGERLNLHGSVREAAGMTGGATVKKLFRSWPRTRLVPHSLRRAAGLGMALGAVILAFVAIGTYVSRHPIPFAWNDMAAVTPPTQVTTGRGQRATIQLPDGSRAVLGVDSHIRYARDFGKQSREIEVEGEAYFDVVHNARIPFRILTPHGVAEDIGTRFSVRAYAGEQATRVIVEEGLVAVGHGVTLVAGDLARLTTYAPPRVEHGVPVQTLLAWTHGQLSFMNAPLRDVVADVRRWYDVDVQLGDPSLGGSIVTASFGKEPLSEVLEFLARAVDARLERRANTWIFVPKERPPTRRQSESNHPASQGE